MRTNFVLVDFENVQPKNISALRGGAFRIKVFVGASQTRFPRDMVLAVQAFGPAAEYIEIEGSGINALDFHIAFYIGRLAATHPDAVFHLISKDRGFDPLIRHLKRLGIVCQRFASVAEIPLLALLPDADDAAGAAVGKVPGLGAGVKVATRVAGGQTAAVGGKSAAAAVPTAGAKKAKPVKPPKVAVVEPKGTVAAKPVADKVTAVEAHLARVKAAKPRTLKTLESSIRNWLDKNMPREEMEGIVAQLVRRGLLTIADGKVAY